MQYPLRARSAGPMALVAWTLATCAAAPVAGQPGTLVARDAWVREAPAGGSTGAYLRIDNSADTAAALVAIEAAAAGIVELHRMTLAAGERMLMEPVPSVPIPAGGRAELRPGGHHAMLFGLTGALEAGDTVDLVLRFDDGTTTRVTAAVRPGAAVGP